MIVLEELERAGLVPTLLVTAPDKPAGRGMKLTPSPAREWARKHDVDTITPETFDEEALARLRRASAAVFVVVAYGKILPQSVLDIPPHGTLNVHPSLLPRLRGPSPVRTAILNDERTVGVSVMMLDEQMDHGPILAQEAYTPPTWPPDADELDTYLFTRGGALLADVLPRYVRGEVHPREQKHENATFSKLFKKEDGLLDLTDDPYTNLLKIHAYKGWPGTYFFTPQGTRVKVLSAHIEANTLILDEVIPEGRGKMRYADFLRSRAQAH